MILAAEGIVEVTLTASSGTTQPEAGALPSLHSAVL